MKTWLAGFWRVGLQSSEPTIPAASSPMLRSALSSVMTPVPMSGALPLSPDSPYCLTKRTACPSNEHRAHRVDVLLDLGEIRREVESIEGDPELLDHLAPAVLEHALKATDLLVPEA